MAELRLCRYIPDSADCLLLSSHFELRFNLTSWHPGQVLSTDLLSLLQPQPCICPAGDAVDVYCHGPGWWQGYVHQIWEGRISVHFPGKQLQCSSLECGIACQNCSSLRVLPVLVQITLW